MQRYAKGDIAAFDSLYSKHKGGLYRYFLRHISDVSVAEDLYQEVWGKVIQSAKSYQASAKFTTWLYTLAHNKLVDHIRRVKVVDKHIMKEQQLDFAETEQELSDVWDMQQAKVYISECLSKLPQLQLDCFLLKEEAGLSNLDISQIVNASLEATKSRMRYAYKSLRACVSKKLVSEKRLEAEK